MGIFTWKKPKPIPESTWRRGDETCPHENWEFRCYCAIGYVRCLDCNGDIMPPLSSREINWVKKKMAEEKNALELG